MCVDATSSREPGPNLQHNFNNHKQEEQQQQGSGQQYQKGRQHRDESVDNYITLVIENFAAAMKTGIPILGIPVLDPINITALALPDIK